MFDKLKKHSVKILVFAINMLLTVIAVFVIREKDQTQFLENVQKEKIPNENLNSNILPSLGSSVQTPAVSDLSSPAVSVPAVTDPAPIQKTAPFNAKTKTS